MGMSPATALILSEGDVLKAPRIHMAAFLYILPRIFKGYERGAQL